MPLLRQKFGVIYMVTLYTSDTCGVCKAMKLKMQMGNIQYQNKTDIEYLMDKGIQRLPVLQLEDGTLISSPSEINAWIKANSEAKK